MPTSSWTTHRTLRYRDLPALFMLRNGDTRQVKAIKLHADLKTVEWTRALTLGAFFLGICTVVAALMRLEPDKGLEPLTC